MARGCKPYSKLEREDKEVAPQCSRDCSLTRINTRQKIKTKGLDCKRRRPNLLALSASQESIQKKKYVKHSSRVTYNYEPVKKYTSAFKYWDGTQNSFSLNIWVTVEILNSFSSWNLPIPIPKITYLFTHLSWSPNTLGKRTINLIRSARLLLLNK